MARFLPTEYFRGQSTPKGIVMPAQKREARLRADVAGIHVFL
jgi:hypothetical protein